MALSLLGKPGQYKPWFWRLLVFIAVPGPPGNTVSDSCGPNRLSPQSEGDTRGNPRRLFSTAFFASTALSESISENLAWNKEFLSESVNGVFVLCKSSSNSCTTNNAARASTAYIPASTFKIPNALIGLETGVIKDERQVFKWDGKPKTMKQWERALRLRGAIQVSAVPVFQQIAREIGETRMQKYLTLFSYGNASIGGGIEKFGLDGQLRISALNQVPFLESLYLNDLPASKENQLIVKEAIFTEATPGYLVYSKTGYSGVGSEANPGIAWWVGWVEKGADVYFLLLTWT